MSRASSSSPAIRAGPTRTSRPRCSRSPKNWVFATCWRAACGAQAIRIDPGYSRAYAGLAAAHWGIVNRYWQLAVGVGWQHSYDALNEDLGKALENPTPLAYSVSAEWLTRQGRAQEALAQIDRALALAPNEADTHVSQARILNVTGRAEEAEQSVRLAMRLNPHYGPDYLIVLGQALF